MVHFQNFPAVAGAVSCGLKVLGGLMERNRGDAANRMTRSRIAVISTFESTQECVSNRCRSCDKQPLLTQRDGDH